MNITKLSSAKESAGFSLYAVVLDKQVLVKDYIDSLDSKNKKQLAARLDQILRTGLPKNERQFRNLGEDIYEIKTKNGARILCFFGGALLGRSLVLTHGMDKSAGKLLRREKRKAIYFLKDFLKNADII